jgi:asparagine synthase (glutamine-hydrolysing)
MEYLWSWFPLGMRRLMREASERIHPKSEPRRRFAKLLRYAELEGDARIESYFWWISPELATRLFTGDARAQLAPMREGVVAQTLRRLPPAVPPLARMLYLEGKFFLADHNLNYVDKVSMANGVEVRVPLLDPDLIALAARLPLRYKQRGRIGKWVLRKAMEPYLPHEVLYREKTGFGAPLRHWLRRDLRALIDEVLSERALAARGIFDPAAVRELVRQNAESRVDAAYTIFSLICFELWCRMFVDAPTPRIT